MSTPNFRTQKEFPLYIKQDDDFYVNDYDVENDVELETKSYCEHMAWYFYKKVEKDIADVNDDLKFHRIELKSGYYADSQFYVKSLYDYEDLEQYDNYECRREFDDYRSNVLRNYKREQGKIRQILKRLAKAHGFIELVCVGVFSNGEAIYERANKKDVRQAVKLAA